MNIKTQMYRTRHLIDVLPARPLSTHGREFNLVQRNVNMGIYHQYQFATPGRKFLLIAPQIAHQLIPAANGYRNELKTNPRVQ